MGGLRRVADDRAGPAALGILVPPAPQTILVLRPRSLAWDLVLLQAAEGQAFQAMSHHEAQAAAADLFLALQTAAPGSRVEEASCPDGNGFWLRARIDNFTLLACARRPGRPYQPKVFPDLAAVRAAAAQLAPVLFPPTGVEQECYFNTRHFGH